MHYTALHCSTIQYTTSRTEPLPNPTLQQRIKPRRNRICEQHSACHAMKDAPRRILTFRLYAEGVANLPQKISQTNKWKTE